MNADMSEIIEYILPSKNEYNDEDDSGGVGGGDTGSTDSVQHSYVVLNAMGNVVLSSDQIHDYDNEEFHIINEAGHEEELLIDDNELQQQLEGCTELQDAMLRTTKHELFDEDIDYGVTEDHIETIDASDEFIDESTEKQTIVHKFSDSPNLSTADNSLSPTLSAPKKLPSQSNKQQVSKFQNTQQSLIRNFTTRTLMRDDEEFINDENLVHECDAEPAVNAKPSDKMIDEFKGPRRYLLFDDLIATIVDFDEENTPIVEFSMISSISDEKLPVECGICPDVMHKAKLSKHQKTHMVPGTNRYACIYCSESYRDCKYLAGHARRHMGIRPYVCELCKLYFSTKQDLRVHNQRRHLEKEHICEMCGKTFAQNTQLKRHREATHEKKRRFQCHYCQKAYYKNFSLQEHIRNVHMGKRRMLSCPFCGMKCRDAHKMARHRKEMHLNQDSYICHLCQEEFTDINYFDAHKRSIQCRSNTRRQEVNEGQQRDASDGTADEPASIFEEEFDEDAGLLVESDAICENAAEPKGNCYLQENQFVQVTQYDPNNYDERLLVENVAEEADQEQMLDDEQYIDAIAAQQQSQTYTQIQQQHVGQEFNNGQLIYEITLETAN